MTINELIKKLELAKCDLGGETQVNLEYFNTPEVCSVICASYCDDKYGNITEVRLTDGDREDIHDELYELYNLVETWEV